MEPIALAAFLSVIANRLIEAIVQPLKKKFPQIDFWWLIYVSWVVGGLLAWASGVNLFSIIPTLDPLIGRVLTAVVVGGGSNLLADLFPSKAQPEL